MGFNGRIGSSYPSIQRALVKLYVDGELKDSKEVNVSTSGASMTFRWLAQAGEHSYVLKLYNLIGGQKFEEDKESGSVSVAYPDQQFAVSLEALPTELEGGGTVWFTVHVKNFENGVLSLVGFVEDGEGAVIKRIDGLEGRIPANGGKNITFSYTVYGMGNHTFKLFLDNYDGKPNGEGEEHWVGVKVTVKLTTSAYATLDCPQSMPQNDERASQCKIKVWNTGNNVFSTRITRVVFGNNVVWNGTDTAAVAVDQVSITVPPHGVNNVSITFTANGIAKLLFGDPFFNYKLPEYSPYLVKVYFTNLPPASDTVEITKANSIVQTVYNYGTAFTSGAFIGAAIATFGVEESLLVP